VPHTAHTLEHNTPTSRNKGGCTYTCSKHKGGCGCTYSKHKGGRTLKTQPATIEDPLHTHYKATPNSKRLGRTLYIPTQTQGGRCYTKEAAATSTANTKRPQLQITHIRYKEATANKREINACTRTIDE
jgi:hypothetical protein